jgi:hypothetical protein
MGYLWRSDNATQPATTILEATYDALKNTRVFSFCNKIYKLLERYFDSITPYRVLSRTSDVTTTLFVCSELKSIVSVRP